MDGYVRVSRVAGREGAGYISPTVQREAIERWAERHGIELATVHVDEDETGGSHDRPGLNLAMERVRSGRTGGIVAWKIDRFSRMTELGLRDLRELHDMGARLAFVVEDLDLHGPVGRLLYTVLLAQHEFFLSQIKASWRTAKDRAMGRGAIIGPTPFGYCRGPDGVLLVDPVTGDIVREAFDVAARAGLHACVRFLTERCATLPDRGERPIREGGVTRAWTTSTVRRLLGHRCYLGEFAYGDLTHTDPDLALVRPEIWHAAQPGEPQRRRRAAVYPLSGLAVCGSCGTHMVGARGGRTPDGGGIRSYRCAASITSWKGERCTAPATMVAHRLEEHVREQALAAARDVRRDVRSVEGEDVELTGALERVRTADWEVEQALMDLTLRRQLGERYHGYLQVRLDEQEAAREAYGQLARARGTDALIAQLPELIADAELEELGVLLRGILSSIVVSRGRGPVEGRVLLVTVDDVEPS